MKKWIFLSMAVFLTSLTAAGQDDMYFASSKKQQAKEAERRAELEKRYAKRQARLIAEREANQNTYYSGSNRNVDDYNRMGGSSYETLPADTGDIISFSAVEGVYPDSVSDFQLTQQMTRFDDYVPSVAYWEGYSAGQRDAWGWHSPWYYSSLYPWYDPWYYDPWYYSSWSWRYGWYDPWYYDYGVIVIVYLTTQVVVDLMELVSVQQMVIVDVQAPVLLTAHHVLRGATIAIPAQLRIITR